MATVKYRNTNTGREVKIEEPSKDTGRSYRTQQTQLIKSMDSSSKWERLTGESTATAPGDEIKGLEQLAPNISRDTPSAEPTTKRSKKK